MIQLKYSGSVLRFKLEIMELMTETLEPLFETKSFVVNSFPLNHRIPCYGFHIKEKPKPIRLNKERLPKGISLENIGKLKKGEDILDDTGKLAFKNADLTLPPKKSRSFAYCSDTLYDETLLEYIHDVDLLYFESTFLEDRALTAKETFHSTARQAATMANKAQVDSLIIGHFSARYKDISSFREEALEEFENTHLAIEGEDYCVEE